MVCSAVKAILNYLVLQVHLFLLPDKLPNAQKENQEDGTDLLITPNQQNKSFEIQMIFAFWVKGTYYLNIHLLTTFITEALPAWRDASKLFIWLFIPQIKTVVSDWRYKINIDQYLINLTSINIIIESKVWMLLWGFIVMCGCFAHKIPVTKGVIS